MGSHLLPRGIIPLLDGHRWRLEGVQNDIVGRGQLYPDVIGAATVCSGGKPREDRAEGGTPAFEGWLWGQLPSVSTPLPMTASRLCTLCPEASIYMLPQFSIQEKGVSLKTKMVFYEDVFPSLSPCGQ